MAEKRYYWLKLFEDFFTSKRIKKLRNLAGGDTYTIIYLKMQLKALKDEGYLYFDGVMNDFAEEKNIVKDLLDSKDAVILVIPIDESAPKGRVILPQQNVLRECLDAHATAICCQVEELSKIYFALLSFFVLVNNAFADGAAPSTAQTGSAFGGLMPILIIFVFFYLFKSYNGIFCFCYNININIGI